MFKVEDMEVDGVFKDMSGVRPGGDPGTKGLRSQTTDSVCILPSRRTWPFSACSSDCG